MNTIDMTTFDGLYALTLVAPGEWSNPVDELRRRAELHNSILGYLAESSVPLRCKDIAAKFGTYTEEHFWNGTEVELPYVGWEEVSARLRPMVRDGIVKRVKMGTETVMTPYGFKTRDIYGYKLVEGD